MLILAILLIAMATGWIAQMILGRTTPGKNNWAEAMVAGFAGSLVGAVIVLAVWGAIRGRRTA